MAGSSGLYEDFTIRQVVETFTASAARLQPGMVAAVVPVVSERGPATLEIFDIKEDQAVPDYYLASGAVQWAGRRRRSPTRADDLLIAKDNNIVNVGKELLLDPDDGQSKIRSINLWAVLGLTSVTLDGIGVTRRVERALKV